MFTFFPQDETYTISAQRWLSGQRPAAVKLGSQVEVPPRAAIFFNFRRVAEGYPHAVMNPAWLQQYTSTGGPAPPQVKGPTTKKSRKEATNIKDPKKKRKKSQRHQCQTRKNNSFMCAWKKTILQYKLLLKEFNSKVR